MLFALLGGLSLQAIMTQISEVLFNPDEPAAAPMRADLGALKDVEALTELMARFLSNVTVAG